MAFPLPQAIDPATWAVGAGDGSVDLVARVMTVPLDASENGARVRAHEMAHVRFSPRKPNVPKRHWWNYMFAEDGRIGILARQVGVTTTPHVDTTLIEGASPRARARVILALLAAMDSQTWTATLDSLETRHGRIVLEAISILQEKPADAKSSFDAACIIDTLPGGDPRTVGGRAKADEWGKLVREQAPLRRAVAPCTSRRQRADEAGAGLAFPHRYFLDGRVFARRDKRSGGQGTILIDGSSSMRWAAGDLDQVLLSIPALRAAVYAGIREIEGIQTLGYLRIIVDDGAIADPSELFSPRHAGGNVVDFPALQWLAEQAPPRVWYSDGQATGAGDLPVTGRLRKQVEEICTTANIKRCTALTDATDYMVRSSTRA